MCYTQFLYLLGCKLLAAFFAHRQLEVSLDCSGRASRPHFAWVGVFVEVLLNKEVTECDDGPCIVAWPVNQVHSRPVPAVPKLLAAHHPGLKYTLMMNTTYIAWI